MSLSSYALGTTRTSSGGDYMSNFSRSTLLLVCFGIVISMAAACVPVASPTPAAATPASTITNILWQWTSVSNRTTGTTTKVPKPQDYTITFRDDGTLNGQADCNTFTGTYSQADGFSITLGAVTTAACGDGSLDQQYLAAVWAQSRPEDPTAPATWRWRRRAASSACCSPTAARPRRPDRGANQLLGDALVSPNSPDNEGGRRGGKHSDHQTAGQVRTLYAHSVVAAPLRPRLVDGGRDRRADAVGPGRAGSHGLCGHRRPAAASRSLYPAGCPACVRAAGHLAPPGCAGYLGDGGPARFVGGGGIGGDRRRRTPPIRRPTRPTPPPLSWSSASCFWWQAWPSWGLLPSSSPSR